MQLNLVSYSLQPEQPMLGVFQSYAPDDAVNFVSFLNQQLRKVRTVLPCDTRNQRSFCHQIYSTVSS